MPILTCRKCQGNGNVEEITHYPRKNIALIVCEKCGKRWFVSTPPDWNETDIIERWGTPVDSIEIETDTGTSKVPDTTMARAFAKALAEKSSKEEPD